MNSERYIKVLEDFVYPISFEKGDPSIDWLYMDDNASCHRSHITKQFKKQMGLRTIEWPPYSPDINPIENIWSVMKKTIRRNIQLTDDLVNLKRLVINTWKDIPQATIDNVINSMSSRVGKILNCKGNRIK